MQTTTEDTTLAPSEVIRPAAADAQLPDAAKRIDSRRRYPASAFRGPLFEARDRIALAMATVMLIGPLAALPLGF
ncbi:hypothetical protein [Rhizobium wuzhouense]|uniref:Uncharacterized protein n=1 Tax=Rhizobium wuzhouense TaxID=1986026 RepID=A0ABX5NUQ4_9HYPH|nr:hypothetical protein [Rhizobium wuzhouense]PYB75447.1 hypothetical protein DMY87_08405 [Rhizobium wuzhouense]